MLADEDLVVAAKTMKNHLALLNREVKTESDAEKLANSLKGCCPQWSRREDRSCSHYE